MTTTKELSRLSHTLIARGALTLGLGLGAVIWPEEMLVFALVLVGTIAGLFGLDEIAIAFGLRHGAPQWRLPLFHGLASIVFGLLTMGVAAVELRVALFVVAGWLVCYAMLAVGVARSLWASAGPRRALMTWAVLNVALALLALAYPEPSIFALLFLGACYAALFGAWQLTVGLWVWRALRQRLGSEQHVRFVG